MNASTANLLFKMISSPFGIQNNQHGRLSGQSVCNLLELKAFGGWMVARGSAAAQTL